MLDADGGIIYVGKSKKLKNRVTSYFVGNSHSYKTARMVSLVRDFDYILCNTEIEALTLDAYTVTNLDLGYTLKTTAAKSVRLGLAIYNLFNVEYCSNGYGYSYMWDGVRNDEAYYFPQAPLHVLANVTVNF